MIWNPTGNLKGPKGDKGDKGDTGDQGPSGASGADWNTNLTGIPANITSWAGIAPSAKQDALGYTPVNKAGDTMTGPLTFALSGSDFLVSSRSGYTFNYANFGNGQFGIWDATASSMSWLYDTASGGVHRFRGQVEESGYRVWSEARFNPASKLDARDSLGISAAYPPGNDWNNANQNGWYMGSDFANAPASGWFIGTVTVHHNDWIQQEVSNFTHGADAVVFRRRKLAGTWTAWTTAQKFGQVSAEPSGGLSAFFADLPYGTQAGAYSLRWNGNRIWQIGAESNGDFKLWAYDLGGNYLGNPLTITGSHGDATFQGRVTSNNAHFNSTTSAAVLSAEGGPVFLRPNGRDSGHMQAVFNTNGDVLIGAALFPGGSGACYLYRVNSERLAFSHSLGIGGELYMGGWVRSLSSGTGWFNEAHGGGIYMGDNTWVRVYNNKGFWADNVIRGTELHDAVGNLRHIPQIANAGNSNLAFAHSGRSHDKTGNGAYTITIQPNAAVVIDVGATVTFQNMGGTTGVLVIARGSGVAIYRNGANANITLQPGHSVTLRKMATDVWQA